MASRFQKKTAPKLPSIPGTKPSLFNFQLLTSSGIPGLDQLLGGGLPLGTLLLIQDLPNPEQENENDFETGQHYSSLLLQYFLSEGVVHGHKLFVGRVDPSPDGGTVQLPAIVSKDDSKHTTEQQSGDDKMIIAWRYEGQAPRSDEILGKARKHHFNLNKVIPDEDIVHLLTKFDLQPSLDLNANGYNDLFKELKTVVQPFVINPKVPASNILRIGISDLGSVLFSDEKGQDNETALSIFLYKLRALARSHLVVIVLTISQDFFSRHEPNEGVHNRIKEMADFVLDLTSFSKDKRKSSAFKDHHGIMELSKAAPLNCLVNAANQHHIRSKYLFRSLRTKFSISPMHLPPDFGDEVAKTSASMNKLEF